MLSESEVHSCWQVYWAGGPRHEEALELLIRQYSRLAAYFARQAAARAPEWQDVEDLLAFAHHGLLKAIQSYDPNAGAKFETWATRVIPKRIMDGQRTLDPLKRPDRQKVKALQAAREEFWERTSRYPTAEQLADLMRMTVTEVHHLMSLEQSITSTIDDHPHIESSKVTHHEGEVEVQVAELRSRLALRLASLGDAGRAFVLHFYVDEQTIADTAKSVTVSRDWVRLTRNQVLEALAR